MDNQGAVVATGALDTRLDGLVAGGRYRLWFQVVNGTDVGIDIGPTLLVGRSGATTAPETVPAPDAVTGQPFFVATSTGGPATLTAGGLRLTTSNDAAATAVDGLVGSGSNPAGTLPLPAHSFTEVGFTVAVTADVVAGADYSFTMTDGGVALAASVTAEARAMDALRLRRHPT